MADPKALAERLRALATGTVEWRVQHPVDKSYCIAFGRSSSFNPERDARRWLEDHRERFPNGRFFNYEVAEVRYLTELERVALEAAAALDDVLTGTPTLPMFAAAVAQRKWEGLQADGHRMQRINFARSVGGKDQRGSIDPWGKVLWEPDGAAAAADGWVEAGLVCQACAGDAPRGKCLNPKCVGGPIVRELVPDGVAVGAKPWKLPPYPATPTEREALAKRQAALGVADTDGGQR